MSQKAYAYLTWLGLSLALAFAIPVSAIDDISISPRAIRDAYFLGLRQGSLSAGFLTPYALWVPELKDGTCTSQVRLETPFLQVAEYASQAPNLSSQDAVEQFYGKPMTLRVYLDVCYKPNAPQNAIKIKVIQNKKEIAPAFAQSSPYIPQITELTTLPPNGECVLLEFRSTQIDSSTLLVRIDTPDAQQAEVSFDLQSLR
jgi:hypothetical protein